MTLKKYHYYIALIVALVGEGILIFQRILIEFIILNIHYIGNLFSYLETLLKVINKIHI